MMSDNRSFFNANMRREEEETTEEINAREDVMVSNAARQFHNIRKECYFAATASYVPDTRKPVIRFTNTK